MPEAELRTSREAAESWKEQPMPGGKVIACESGDGAKRFVKRKTETSVTELKRWCCGPPVEVSNTEGISIGGTVSWDMKVLPAIHVRSTRVQMAVDDEEEERLESGTSRVSCGLQREDEERQLQMRPRKELNSGEQSECAETGGTPKMEAGNRCGGAARFKSEPKDGVGCDRCSARLIPSGSCQSGAHMDGTLYLKSMVPALRKFYNRRIRKKLWANQECVVGRVEWCAKSVSC